MPTHILIVDDHPIFLSAIEGVLSNLLSGVRITTAQGLEAAKAAVAADEDLDVVLLDLWLPDTQGYEGLMELRRLRPKLPIIVLSAFADQVVVHKTMMLGASGFIAKSASAEEIARSVMSVLAGDVCLPAGYRPPSNATDAELAVLTTRLKSLTHQQLRVLQMLCQGLLNKEIAYQLNVGETTVKAHVSEILRKLAVVSRTQAVLEVSRLDLSSISALYAR